MDKGAESTEDAGAAFARESFPTHAGLGRWLDAHAGTSMRDALATCDEPSVLVRLWMASSLPMEPLFRAVVGLVREQLTHVPPEEARDAATTLDRIGVRRSIIAEYLHRRRCRRLLDADLPILHAVVQLASGAPDRWHTAHAPGRDLPTPRRDDVVQALDATVTALVEAIAEARASAPGSAFREAPTEAIQASVAASIASSICSAAFAAAQDVELREARAKFVHAANLTAPILAEVGCARFAIEMLAFALCFTALIGLIAALTSFVAAMVLGAVLGFFAAMQLGTRRGANGSGLGSMLAVAAALAGAMGGPSAYQLTRHGGQTNVSVHVLEEGAPLAPWYTFVDGRVLTELAVTHTDTGHDPRTREEYTRDHRLAPIVAADWSPGEAISGWAYCAERRTPRTCRECVRRWDLPNLGAVEARHGGSEPVLLARALAAEATGLRGGETAPVLEWVSDPLSAYLRDLQIGAFLLCTTYVVGLLAVFAERRRRRRRS